MKYILKKFWLLILICAAVNIPILKLGTTRTNMAIILKGDCVEFTSVVDVNTNKEEAGSFSTIYVISMEHSTMLQNIITKNDPTTESYEISPSYTHLTNEENNRAGLIQYDSSVSNAIVLAYNEAKRVDSSITIDYEFLGFFVTYYSPNSQFRIGDRIINIKTSSSECSYLDEPGFRKIINEPKYVGDIYTVIRDGVTMDIPLTVNDSFSASSRYEVNESTPSLSIKSNNVQGPSGGLLQTLSIYNRITENDIDITHGLKIAGTGTIAYDGSVGAIGGIREKIPTALDDNIDIFFCPKANEDEALEAYNSLPNRYKMKLVVVETFYDALYYLKEGYKNDFEGNI